MGQLTLLLLGISGLQSSGSVQGKMLQFAALCFIQDSSKGLGCFCFIVGDKAGLGNTPSKHLKGHSGPRVSDVFGPNIPEVIRDPASVTFLDRTSLKSFGTLRQ